MDIEKEIAMYKRELEVAKAVCDRQAVVIYEYKIKFMENKLKNTRDNKPEYPGIVK